MNARPNDDRKTLEEERTALTLRLNEIEGLLAPSSDQGVRADDLPNPPTPRQRQVPLRILVLDSLQDFGTIAYSRELALYLPARYGRKVNASRFGTLGSDEATASKNGRPRPVSLCHGITAERGEAIKRLWGRSDWPLAERVVAPTTGRVQHLQMTISLCRIAEQGDHVADPDMMRILAADHARDVPGLDVRRGTFELDVWLKAAQELLHELLPVDRLSREAAADDLSARLSDGEQLFGVADSPLFLVREDAKRAMGT